jgi:Flp pilus assembly protein TadG
VGHLSAPVEIGASGGRAMTAAIDGPRKRIARRFGRAQGGATSIEFAMVAAPFLYLLMAIFETGLMLFAEYIIENGVAKAARQIRTGQVQTQGMSASQFKTLVCGNLAAFLDCDANLNVDVRSFTKFADVDLPAPLNEDGTLSESVTSSASFDPGDAMEVVVVRPYYAWKLFTPGITHLANMAGDKRLLTAGAAFRNEPFSE